MKKYFSGFFTAVCLTVSVFLFIGANDIKDELIIKDENGWTVINGLGLQTYNLDGKATAFIGNNDFSSAVGGSIRIFDDAQNIKIGAFVGEEKSGALAIYCDNNAVGTIISANPAGGSVNIYSATDEAKVRGLFNVTENDDGRIILVNDKNNYNVNIGSLYNDKHKGDGFINLYDRYGDFGWGITGKN